MTEKSNKYIFLDFDGVLNTDNYQLRCRAEGLPHKDEFGPVFDPEAIENLGMILQAVPEARIVITSSWNIDGLEVMRLLWEKRRLPGCVLDITHCYIPDFDNMSIAEIMNVSPVGRGADIKAWQEENNAMDAPYVIIDDLPDIFPEQKPHFVQTDPCDGITLEDAMKAIAILNG